MGKRNRVTARPAVERLEDRAVPSVLVWNDVNDNSAPYNASNPKNYYNQTTGTQNTETSFSTTDILTFTDGGSALEGWQHNATFLSSVNVNAVRVDSSWAVSSYFSKTISINGGVAVSTNGGSLLADPYAFVSMGSGASLELVDGSEWSADPVSGGTILCDGTSGKVTIDPPGIDGDYLNANTDIHVAGGQVYYTGEGDLALQGGGDIRVDGGGYFLGEINPTPPDGADQHITAANSNPNNITVTSGTFEVNGWTHAVQLPIAVNGTSGVLLVDAGTVLSDAAGVSASAGYIQLQGGQQAAPTTIDTGSTGLSLTGSSTLMTVNDSASYHFSQIDGNLTAGNAATVWVGYHLSGIGFSSGLGANLYVNGNVTMNGTLEVGVYTFGNPRPPVGYVAAYLSCNQSVTFGGSSKLAIDKEGPGQPQSGDDMLIVDCTPGSGTTNEPFLAEPGYTMGLEDNNQQLWLTKD